ncbi:hypothetical protein N7488_010295 [Penicillium malachiteum]|nr:hypothetical protein N7488_010295 [Penicillium malachiteum]
MSNNQECAGAMQWSSVPFQDAETQYEIFNDLVDVQMLQQSLICDLLGFPNDPESWALENQMNFGSPLGLPKDYDQQWQLWNQANLINPENKEGLFMTRCAYCFESHYSDESITNMILICRLLNNSDTQSMQHPDEQKQQGFSHLAAERALFMTPLTLQVATSTSTFPGSPLSDLSSTTEFSHLTYNQWEVDRDRDEFRSPSISDAMSDAHSVKKSRNGSTWSTTCHPFTADDYPAVLEMPDGSTRRNSNWLPVDPNAGFTIGSCSYSDGRDPKDCFAGEEIHDIQDAFISHGSAQWIYDG